MTIKIIHNPRCSKSREGLKILNENGVEPEIIEYLKKPLSKNEIREIVSMLSISPRELLRKGEADYKENNLSDKNLSDEELIEAMAEFPKLIERPIVINEETKKAVIGRPPEDVLSVL